MQYRKISELKKLKNNPRTIRDKKFKTLCKSIKDNPEYFEARPLILSDRTGEFIIIAGNQRYEAARYLRLTEVPTYMIEHLTEEKEQEIIIRDNISLGEFDFNILANEWSDLPLSDWGLDEINGLEGSDKEKLYQEEKEIHAYKKIHILIPIELGVIDSIVDLLDELKKRKGIEIEQSSN